MSMIHHPRHLSPAEPGDAIYRRLRRELASRSLPDGPDRPGTVTEADVAGLPAAGRRYLDFMGVMGRERHWSFRVRFEGRFQLKGRWMPASAWQYDSAVEIGRVFVMRLRLARVVPMIGVDTYLGGDGQMRGRMLGIIPVAHGAGDAFDLGELVTWLNDAVLLAPSFLLAPAVTWSEVDANSFDVSVADAGNTVSARVFVDDRGAPVDFSTSDRVADLGGGLVHAEWRTPIDGWSHQVGQPMPTGARAVWHLPDGPMTYAEGRFVPESLAYDVSAGT